MPTKVLSLTLRKHTSTGRFNLFWLLLTKNDPTENQSDQLLNKAEGFLTKILDMFNPVNGRFHEKTKINNINHQCIQIDRWVKQTCRHRTMDIGAAVADDQTSYFIIVRQEKCLFGQKLQYNVVTN